MDSSRESELNWLSSAGSILNPKLFHILEFRLLIIIILEYLRVNQSVGHQSHICAHVALLIAVDAILAHPVGVRHIVEVATGLSVSFDLAI